MPFQFKHFRVGRFLNFEARVWRAQQNGDRPACGEALTGTEIKKGPEKGITGTRTVPDRDQQR